MEATFASTEQRLLRLLGKGRVGIPKAIMQVIPERPFARPRTILKLNTGTGGEKRSYFVDVTLLQAVTDELASYFVTYYPLSFDGTVKPEELAEMENGDRRLKFEEWLENKELGHVFQNVQRNHGFD